MLYEVITKRTSDVQTKGVNAKETNSETTIVLTDIQVNKSTEQILSGTATVSITGSLASKGDFSYSGTITFNGAGLATLVLGSKSYSVNLRITSYNVCYTKLLRPFDKTQKSIQ